MYSCSEGHDSGKLSAKKNYSLLVLFHGDDLVKSTSVDVSEENTVVVVTKAAECQREWVWFEAGVNSHSLEVSCVGRIVIGNHELHYYGKSHYLQY